ncbi:MFS general substrate transporter [Cryphonectria parasitica EP155]|uniref:MFS general substrate transporter n=1 Tax=Cryphonectria parasitica (strain ATCC 38755 / EP155) TaxID=660469 RepID=A0A9P5CQS7_CRYP1|nr:MFS general substrate transporter [Cryphonectria parasitica EP155]KAF3766772.1 MFS general substrate transporter [Cryphonectria parasitica EP155]
MNLTRQRSIRNPDDFPTLQLFLLAIVRLAEPIALTSVFPYAWQLVKRFKVGNEEDASTYSGLLISSFALAEAVMGMYWGGVSDRIGRKPVLLFGCVGTMISMLVLGFAPNIWVALLGRIVGGALNGNIGVIQTMVGELVKKPEHEPCAYSIMPFVWSVGTIVGPCIGGTFADPHETWPSVFPRDCLFDRFPYLLPNLICAALLLVSIVAGYVLLEETHSDINPCVVLEVDAFTSEETPLRETSDAIKRPAVDIRAPAYGTFRSQNTEAANVSEEPEKPITYNIFSDKRIMALVISLSIYAYHAMCYDHLLPIFLEDERVSLSELGSRLDFLYFPGGLGLSMNAVGVIMAFNGVIALFIQAIIFPIAAEKIGVFRLFVIVTVLHPIACLLMPFLIWVPESLLYPTLYVFLAVRDIFSIIVYPLLLILLKEATPSSGMLGKVNGFAASAGAACRMIAPPVAGFLYTVGSRVDCTALAWWGSALVAVVGSIQCFSVERTKAGKIQQHTVTVTALGVDEEEEED